MVTRDSRRRGFTLIDLAAVVVMGGVLVVALAAGVRQMQPRDNQVMCLTNLQRIGAAIHAYAAEDPREQAIPIHMNMVGYNDANQPTGVGLDYWLWRTANAFAWGGQGATETFYIYAEIGFLLNDPNELAGALPPDVWFEVPEYAGRHRPLNGYIAPDPLTTFRCPSDAGFPDSPYIDDVPQANAFRACWATLGNSYRANLRSYGEMSAGSLYGGAFSTGPWGHRLSILPNPGRLALVSDALWGTMAGGYPGSPPLVGWHGILNADNVLFCDGSARLTSVEGQQAGTARRPLGDTLVSLDSPPTPSFSDSLLVAGPDWQLDCYPAPGAVVWGDWSSFITPGNSYWPFKNAYLNPSGGQLSVDAGCAGENP